MDNETAASVMAQIVREEELFAAGIRQYKREKANKSLAETKPGASLLARSVHRMTAAIEALVERTVSGKAGRGRPSVLSKYLKELDAGSVAVLTIRAALNTALLQKSSKDTAIHIAGVLQQQYQFEALVSDSEHKGLAIRAQQIADKWRGAQGKTRVLRTAASRAGMSPLAFDMGDRVLVGIGLLNVFVQACGLVEFFDEEQFSQKKGYKYPEQRLRLTPRTSEWLDGAHARYSEMQPLRRPMVCPPVPWEVTPEGIRGGYLTPSLQQQFIRGRNGRDDSGLDHGDLNMVCAAVNNVQAVPWRINRRVAEVFSECIESGSQIGGMVSADKIPQPGRPSWWCEEVDVQSLEGKQAADWMRWKREAAIAYGEEAERANRRKSELVMNAMIADLQAHETIYFPSNVDFRGRIYPIPSILHSQGSDRAKAMLEFAEGKPIGSSGAYWLFVHIANQFGVNKVSFDDRVKWVHEHEAQLLDSAASPLDGRRFWCTADKPWQALASCFEFAGWCTEGDDYVSRIPVHMDGSCSGLQHLSALLRDEVGGAAVNLLPTDSPADVYSEVAEKVAAEVAARATAGIPEAVAWHGHVNRKLVKPSCMTLAYSATSQSRRQSIEKYVRDVHGKSLPYGLEAKTAAVWLEPIVLEAIKASVPRAMEAMRWLQDAARAMLDAEAPVSWAAPTGMRVTQPYHSWEQRRVKVWIGGQRVRYSIYQPPIKGRAIVQDRRKHGQSVAANFVHSLDASHLMLVVNSMAAAGHRVAVVHDSFGTHAGDVDLLREQLTEQFAYLHSGRWLAQMAWEMARVGVRPPPAWPVSGNLSWEEVGRSTGYMFG